MYDTLIVGATIIDGTGNQWFLADVGISSGRIAAVGRLGRTEGNRVLQAQGLVAAPGFIDAHAHSDFALTLNPGAESQVAQGITTEVDGNCGYSAFPLFKENRHMLLDPEGIEVSWSSAHEYFDVLRANVPGVNAASHVGHTTVRAAVMGAVNRKPSEPEMERMKDLVREAMEAGAVGLSTGLEYAPGSYAEVEELVELVTVVREYGGVHASHIRSYTGGVLEALDEAFEIGRLASAATHIAHYNVCGLHNQGLAQRGLEAINRARAGGFDVSLDTLGYRKNGAWAAPRAIFPEWAYNWKANNMDHLIELLRDPGQRAQLKSEVEARRRAKKIGLDEERTLSDWEEVYIDAVRDGSPNESFVGLSIPEVAARLGVEPCEAYFDLLLQEGRSLTSVRFPVTEHDSDAVLRSPMVMFSTDTVATSLEAADAPFNVFAAHPRHYGLFPYVLGRYVREEKKFLLEEAIRRVTSLPAQRFGLQDRGLIRVGMAADIVLFDPCRVASLATFRQPRVYPTGIEYVLVNGQMAVDEADITGRRGGQVLCLGHH